MKCGIGSFVSRRDLIHGVISSEWLASDLGFQSHQSEWLPRPLHTSIMLRKYAFKDYIWRISRVIPRAVPQPHGYIRKDL